MYSNIEYLANPFNLSINSLHNDDICDILNLASANIFYYIIFKIINKLKEIREQEQDKEREDVLEGNDTIKCVSEIPVMVFNNVFDDETVDDKVKKDLTSLLELNSLDRHYILYYIFKKRGSFYDGYSYINIYAYYKTVVNEWNNIYCTDDPLDLKMNLDETLENDYQIVIDNVIGDCNMAHVRFLTWLYYSGIYNYLMDNQEIKKTVLDDMNTKKLLIGNVFLKYQLYLIEMENKENNVANKNKDANNCADKINDTVDDDVDDAVDDDVDYTSENEKELNKRPINEDISDMNEIAFAYKLLNTVINITRRALISTWTIVKEEADELFHPVLG